ncbi:MAG: hypothetical protein Q4F60_03280 [Candidatus Saccharibacteria bacterium]|nr:hypothetical protein [Candidatus Saccharibacteria bacterium]
MSRKVFLGALLAIFLGVSLRGEVFASASIGNCSNLDGSQGWPGSMNFNVVNACSHIYQNYRQGLEGAVGLTWINSVANDNISDAVASTSSSFNWNGQATAFGTIYLRGAWIQSAQGNLGNMDARCVQFTSGGHGDEAGCSNLWDQVSFIFPRIVNTLNRGKIGGLWSWSSGWIGVPLTFNIHNFTRSATVVRNCGYNCTDYRSTVYINVVGQNYSDTYDLNVRIIRTDIPDPSTPTPTPTPIPTPEPNIEYEPTPSPQTHETVERTGERVFGSWSETSFIQGGSSSGFASSSRLGGIGMKYDRYNGYYCTLSPVSIANVGDGATCQSSVGLSSGSGSSKVLIDSGIESATKDMVEKLLLRYMPQNPDASCHDEVVEGMNKCRLAEVNSVSPGRYEYFGSDANITSRNIPLDEETGTTRVVIVNGTATIAGNICVGTGEGSCTSNDSELKVGERNKEGISDIRKLKNVIIIANNIRIDASVTQIDAMLVALGDEQVANRKMGNSGVVNTCGHYSGGDIKDNINDMNNNNDIVNEVCNKTLLVNGPILAGKLIPNRTIYKMGDGKDITPTQDLKEMGSSTPAEVFNLNPFVYMWAFEQASRYTQANTVYTQELAPRM